MRLSLSLSTPLSAFPERACHGSLLCRYPMYRCDFLTCTAANRYVCAFPPPRRSCCPLISPSSQLQETLPEEDEAPELQQPPSLARKISSEYLRLGQLFFGRLAESSVPSLLPSVAQSDVSPAGDDVDDAVDSEVVVNGLGDGSDSDRPRSHRRPPQKRGGSYEGVAVDDGGMGGDWGIGTSKRRDRTTGKSSADGEDGLEMQATGTSVESQQEEKGPEGRRRGVQREGADGALPGRTNGVPGAAGDGDAPLAPPSPPSLVPTNVAEDARGGSLSLAAEPVAAGGADRIHGETKRFTSSRAGGPYLGGVDGGGDRWIGFAGSPRGDRTREGQIGGGSDVRLCSPTTRLSPGAAGVRDRGGDGEGS